MCNLNISKSPSQKREAMRKKYDLKGTGLQDCLELSCCGFCAICQEANEVVHQEKDFAVPYCAPPVASPAPAASPAAK